MMNWSSHGVSTLHVSH